MRKIHFLDLSGTEGSADDGKTPGKRTHPADIHEFDDFAAAFAYRDEMRESVLRFKYSGRAEYAAFYGAALWAYTKETILGWQADLILPVPGDAGRMRERGYNQAQLLAEEISRLSGIPESPDLVKRIRRTKPQNGLDPVQRRINLVSAFQCARIPPPAVIVVDDILTTGSTMDAVAGCLKEAGAKKVFALCLCAD